MRPGVEERLLSDITGLLPLVAENARRAEIDRKPVDEVMAAIEATGAYRSFVPRAFGGWETGLDTFVDIGLLLSGACTSTAWVVCFCLEHSWMVAQFPRQAQDEIFGDRGYVIAPGALAATGKAAPVERGYRLSGRWQWGTGVMHANWVLLGGMVEGTRDLLMFAAPVEQVRVMDNWDASGMAGTGSNDIIVDDLFIPAHRAQSVGGMAVGRTEGGLSHGTPMFRMPMMPILSLAAGTPSLGAAKAALAEFITRSRTRTLFGSTGTQADHPTAHILIGEVQTRLAAAETLTRAVAAEAMRWGECDDVCPVEVRAEMRARMALVVRISRDAVRDLVQSAGASAQLTGQPLERIHRDVHTIASHTVFDFQAISEQTGRLALGLKPTAMI